jgi:hypothetical protein
MDFSELDQIKLNKWVNEMKDEDLLERLVEHAHLDGVILGAIAVEVRRRFKKLRWDQ